MSDAARHAQIKALFLEVVELAPAERAARLAAVDDPALAAAVQRLVTRDAAPAALDKPLQDLHELAADAAVDEVPETIAGFRLVGLLGRGGMGVVFEAIEPGTERHVALKVMAPGLVAWSGSSARVRFAREIQALGRLEHPGIARILANGELPAAEGGRPWYALELVRGQPLVEAVRRAAFDLDAIVQLFVRVARAVGHAHERGIAHRDLKPANILVTAGATGAEGVLQPKVLDFGIARLLEENAATRLTVERTAQFVGTLAYLAPERLDAAAQGSDDRRADVYALGTLLWEVLFGQLPLALESAPLAVALERIAREELPSARGRKLTRGTSTTPRDLAIILDTALARDPLERYADANALAADLERFAADRPIEARPASRLDRATKFVRRHRGLVASTLVVLLVLATAVVLTAREAHRARAAERRAEAVRDFLLLDTLAAANPWASGRVALPDLLAASEAAMDTAFEGDPETLALVAETLGAAWAGLGDPARARGLLERALELAPSAEAEQALRLRLAKLALDQERPDLARAELDAIGLDSPVRALLTARLASLEGDFEGAAHMLDGQLTALAERPVVAAPGQAPFVAQVHFARADNALRSGDYDAARASIEAARASTIAALGAETAHLLPVLRALVELERATGDQAALTARLTEASELLAATLGADHPAGLPFGIAAAELAFLIDGPDAGRAALDALPLPPATDAPQLALAAASLRAWIDLVSDRPGDALAAADQALALAAELYGEDGARFAKALADRAPIHEWRGRPDLALEDLEAAVELFARHTSPLQVEHLAALSMLGTTRVRLGGNEAAVEPLRRATALAAKLHGEDSQLVADTRHELATALLGANEPEEARALFAANLTWAEDALPERGAFAAASALNVALTAYRQRDLAAAHDFITGALDLDARFGLPQHNQRVMLHTLRTRLALLDEDREAFFKAKADWLATLRQTMAEDAPAYRAALAQSAEWEAELPPPEDVLPGDYDG